MECDRIRLHSILFYSTALFCRTYDEFIIIFAKTIKQKKHERDNINGWTLGYRRLPVIKNKQWLAEKLRVSLSEKAASKEDEILAGIARSVKEAKTGQTLPLESIWERL